LAFSNFCTLNIKLLKLKQPFDIIAQNNIQHE
jgi:hypothetical protein